jgi:threonine/homoserine/homoserine lactone efflux protein|tara:strand:+ start:1085 stop:1723 length:639 start_codon:yes stop_codon:yes gene_type:complete
METDLVLGLAIAGIMLGVVEGIKPGPLLTTVIKETLTNGFKGGIRAASAPFFTDGPLILFSIFMAGWIANQPLVFCGIAILGAIFLTRMGMECFNPEIPDIDSTEVDLNQSFKKGILTNLLNPNAYIFWLLIGGPLMATVADSEPIAPFAYAISFLISIVLVKITIAYFFSKAQVNLSSDRYLLTLKICGLAMFIFAGSFLYKAFDLWQNGL